MSAAAKSPGEAWAESVDHVLAEVRRERSRQDAKWGEQNHPDGTSEELFGAAAESAKRFCAEAASRGEVTWSHILNEEVVEAFAETDQGKLRAELIQVAAVTVAWIQKIDRDIAREGGAR